jgi:hypothetical protein
MSAADEAVIENAVAAGAGVLRAKLATGEMKLPDLSLGNAHVDQAAQTALDVAGAVGAATNLTKDQIAARIVGMVGHALGDDPAVPSVAPVAPPNTLVASAGAVAKLAILGVVLGGTLVLSACGTPAQQQLACQTDKNLVPIADTTLTTLVPGAAPAVSIDTLLVHPAVVAYCATLGGTPAAVTTGATSSAVTPTSTPVPTPTATN